jgi:CRP-like cAMP-binding protein
MSRSIARESLNQTMAIIDASCGDARRRLIKLLSQQTLSNDDTKSDIELSAGMLLKKNEIAKLLAVTPEHLSRLIRELKRDGVLDCYDRKIVLRRTRAAV